MKKYASLFLIIIYVLISQKAGKPKSKHTYEGMSKTAVEKMLKAQKAKFKIVTQKEFDATPS